MPGKPCPRCTPRLAAKAGVGFEHDLEDARKVCTCPAPYGGIGGDVYPHIEPCPKTATVGS